MIKHLKDHRGVPLLFGIITKSEPIRLVTKFHRNKNKGLTLHKAIKKEKLEKPTWLEILKKIIEALNHIHSCGIPHNDVKSNDVKSNDVKTNVVMEQRGEEWNPVIIDFGKARRCPCPPINRRSIENSIHTLPPKLSTGVAGRVPKSDIFSLGKIVLAVLDLLPTATARSLKVARTALRRASKTPLLKGTFRGTLNI